MPIDLVRLVAPKCPRLLTISASSVGRCCSLSFSGQFCSLLAQSERGTVSGEVRDSTSAVIPGAKVTLTDIATNASNTATTNASGAFTFPNLPVGQFNLRVDKDGFRSAIVTNVTVNASANVRTDVTLEVGVTQQAIEVQASSVTLQTEDSKSSSTVTNKLVDELPLVVGGALRSPFDLASSDAGSQEPRRRQRLHPRRRPGGELRHHAGRRLRQHVARAFARAGSRPTRLRSKPSPSSPSIPTASRPNTATRAAES